MEKAFVSSLALSKSEVRFNIVGVPDQPGVAARVLSELAKNDIPVGMIVQSAPSHRGVNDISLLTPRQRKKEAQAALEKARRSLKATRVDLYEQLAKISVIGTGFRHHSWVAAKVFNTLAKHKINIQMISTSDLKISCVVPRDHGEIAIKALHKAFQLHRSRRR